ncbi:hypothetical protein M434DRAFT_386865 [Hypoxylon sp. CO27-5]|nr:hypothetical protein M434DRAFT_386865 [Hypoxylon sp. CO27-5]
MPSQLNSASFNTFWAHNYQFLASIITLYISRSQSSRHTMRNEGNDRTPQRSRYAMERSERATQQQEGIPTPPDSAISMSNNENRFGSAMDTAIHHANRTSVSADHDGVTISLTPQQLTLMGAELAQARADGRFPSTTAAGYDISAIAQDYGRLVALTEARGDAPREEWNSMPNVVQLLVRITQEIRARDEITAEQNEEERVRAHVSSMMTGVGAEAKLYSIVQHAVTYAIKNGSSEQAATITGKNMADLLNGIRGVIKDMAGQGVHGVHDVNTEAVLEEVFSMIDYALGDLATPLHKDVENLGGRVKHMDGQIIQLNAIAGHANAIDNHVHALGNNLNAMGTLLNSTNGNVAAMSVQVSLLQTIINMVPRMIAEALQESIPEALNSAMSPIMAYAEAQLGVSVASPLTSPTSTISTDASQEGMLHLKQKKSKKYSLKKLLKLFKKSGHNASS